MAREDLYGSFGSADYKAPSGEFAPELRANPSPNAFGANVGEAQQKLGATEEDVGEKTVKLADQYQGLINETMATNAESQLIMKNGALKGDFMSKEGLEASAALPGYMNEIQNNDQEIRKNLPAGALRSYDMLATRQKANYISDAQSYAAGQIKKANMDSHALLVNAAEMAPLDPDVANNPSRVGDALGTVSYAHGAALDPNTPGLVTDADGNVKFDDSEEGNYAKDVLQTKINNSKSVIWQNTIKTLADQNPLHASQVFTDNKDSMPKNAQVAIAAYLEPKVVNYRAEGATGYTLLQAQHAHQEFLTNPSSAGSDAFNLGNVKTAEGSAKGTADFQHYASPVDGAMGTANNLIKNYQGLTLAQIGAKWAPSSENKTSDWVSNVSKESGISPDTVPDLSDPATLQKVLKGIATAEKSPTDRANFTDDVISQGVQGALSGKLPETKAQAAVKPYATNPDGSPVSQADYYAAHRDQILAWGEKRAEQDYPGNPTYRNMIRERLNNQMAAAIQSQAVQYRQDNMSVQKAITTGGANGQSVSTYQELQQLPGMKDVLDRVWVQDPKYAEGIDTQIQKLARKDEDVNSPNGYSTLQRALMAPSTDGANNRIYSQDQLDKLMGRSDGTGINYKDYKEALPVLDVSQDMKDAISKQMDLIKNANGNVDGGGETRALSWYNNAMRAYQNNEAKGDKKIPEDEFVKNLTAADGPPQQGWFPSRIQQISKLASSLVGSSKEPEIPKISSPNDPEFTKLPSGAQFITPDGQTRVKK